MTYINLQCEPTLNIQPIKEEQAGEVGQPLLNQNKILQAIETFSIGFIQLDFNWKIRYWNIAAEKLTGYKQIQVMNKNLFDVVTEMNHIEFYRTWQNNLKSRKAVQFRDYFWPTQKWFEFHLYSSGEDIIVHFRDITKKLTTRKTLSKKISQLKEVSMFNSHAIRKPLANLMGLTNLLDADLQLNEIKEYVSHIQKSAKSLDEIIRKINSIANDKTENDHISSLEHFHFKNLLNEVKEELMLENKKHKLMISCSNVLFYGNKEGIRYCIKTLTINALKHSSNQEQIKISVRVKDGNLYVRVRDFGVGMSKEILAEIHSELINHKTNHDKKKFPKIAKLCLQHNGSFWIESHIHKGTSYFMLFPLSSFSIFRPGFTKKLLSNAGNEISLNFDVIHQCLYVKWDGYIDSANVKKSFYKIYEAMKIHQCSKVISNETNQIGAGIDCIKWLEKYGFPMLFKAGLSHFAWITSKNEFARLSAISIIKTLNKHSTIKNFPEYPSALHWITGKTTSNAK